MASLEKRGNSWRAQIRSKGLKSVAKTFRTKAAAERWARQVEQEMDVRTWTDADDAATSMFQ